MGGEELKRRQVKHNQLMCPQVSPHCTANNNDKSKNLRKNGIYRYSHVVTASVYSEKTRLKCLIMIIIIIMNKSQETMDFGGCQILTSAMKQRPKK